jgi:hypothetical protein
MKLKILLSFSLSFFLLFFLLIISSSTWAAGENAAGGAGLSFSDQTTAANLSFMHTIPITSGFPVQMVSGAAAGDFNNDGWVDLFAIGGGVYPDALFINQKDGTFQDMAATAGLADLHVGSAAAVGDYNNDGWLDLYVTSLGPPDAIAVGQHKLYRNNGDLTFTDVAVAAGVNQTSPVYVDGMGAAFGDYDLDGDLDLMVAGWYIEKSPDEDPDPAMGNRLFRNNGDSTFTDVSADAGIIGLLINNDNETYGFSPCFADMDGDRYPELLLASDFGTTLYFKNKTDGTFTNLNIYDGDPPWSGMGTAVGDIDGDGLLDWYVTAIYDDAAGQPRGDGNKLYLNEGNHSFAEVADTMGVDDGGWGWGTVILDVNHDGKVDIVETNGWDLPLFVNERSKVWIQNGGNTFDEMAAATSFNHTINGVGLLNFDYDRDGDQDFIVTAFNNEMYLYRNDLTGADTNWLKIILNTQLSPDMAPNGFGSRVVVEAGGETYYRYLNGCSHYLTASEPVIHFGLGAATQVTEVRIEWPNGEVTILGPVNVNQTLMILSGVTNNAFVPFISR